MGEMRVGYGSEFQLLRMLGRHREHFNEMLLRQFAADRVHNAERIEWPDVHFNPGVKTRDGEWQGMDFLPGNCVAAWQAFWPDRKAGQANRKGAPSWDAVGRLHFDSRAEWLLIEAKAHEAELTTKCKATSPASLDTITRRLSETFVYCGGKPDQWAGVKNLWLGHGYQLANRLACLRFLRDNNQPARLVFVYFIGDTFPRMKCPAGEDRWRKVVGELYGKMGLPEHHALSGWIHYVFPHVAKS
jgi:hypothetical protein